MTTRGCSGYALDRPANRHGGGPSRKQHNGEKSMATTENERTVKVKHSTDMVMEAAIIGLCIFFGLQSIEIKVEVVVDRPAAEQQSKTATTLKREM
jgi:hypothetical protein